MENWKRNLYKLIVSQSITLLGSEIVQYAIIWYVMLTTQSGIHMTIATVSAFLPGVIISPFAGVLADRFNRKHIVIMADLAIALSTVILALMFIAGDEALHYIFIILALRSIGSGIQEPASMALLPMVVPEDKVLKANGMSSTFQQLSNLAAPALGGLIFATFGLVFAFFLDFATAIIGSLMLSSLKVEHVPHLNENNTTVRQEISQGINYIRKDPVLNNLLMFYFVFFFFVAPIVFLTPLMVARSFGAEIWRLTIFEMMFSIGSVLGGVFIALHKGFNKELATVGFSAIVFSLLNIMIGVVNYFVLLLLFSFIAGIFVTLFYAPATSFVQKYVPKEMLGRVMSSINVVLGASLPLGMLAFGPLADIISVESILVIAGLVMLIISVRFKNNPVFKGL